MTSNLVVLIRDVRNSYWSDVDDVQLFQHWKDLENVLLGIVGKKNLYKIESNNHTAYTKLKTKWKCSSG